MSVFDSAANTAASSNIDALPNTTTAVTRIVIAVATIYAGRYIGQDLYCGCGLIYSENTVPWVAVDVSEYLSGNFQCGDVVLIFFENGEYLRVQALDAGYLYKYYIEDWPRLPIMFDIPAHLAPFEGLSARVTDWVNLSALERQHPQEHWYTLMDFYLGGRIDYR